MLSRGSLRTAIALTLVTGGSGLGGLGTASAASAGSANDPFAAVAYQHDPVHDGDSPDPAFVAPLTKAWSTTFDDTVGYPLIADGRVFVTVGGNRVEALSAATGEVLWGPTPIGTIGTGAIAYDAGRVFAVDFDGNVTALDATTGAVDWTTQLAPQIFFTSPPTAVDGTVYIGGEGRLYALDETSGTTTWTAAVQNGDHSSPAVDSTGVYVSYACEQAYRFALDGTLVWHHETDCGGGGGRTPVLHGGKLYVRDDAAKTPAVLDAGTGGALSSYDADPAPAFDGGTMATVSGGVLTVSSLATGAAVWHTTSADNVTAPLIANGYVVEGRSDGTVEARQVQDGHLAWAGNVGTALTRPDEHNVSPPLTGLAEGDGALVVPAGATLTVFVPAGDTHVDITGGPEPLAVGGPEATFSFTSQVQNAEYVCTLDDVAASCTSPVTYRGLDDGTHQFSVSVAYATGGAASRAFVVDTVAPTVRMNRFVPLTTRLGTATAHWSATDTRSGVQAFQLRVRQAPFGSRLPSWIVQPVTSAGSAVLHVHRRSRLCASVRAEDGTGNWSGWSAAQCVRRAPARH
jgi:outer membrane protein assembly factor BamB